MERILINDDILKYAQMYEQAFRRYQLDVPTRLRNIASKLDKHNDKNKLSPDELEQYKRLLMIMTMKKTRQKTCWFFNHNIFKSI